MHAAVHALLKGESIYLLLHEKIIPIGGKGELQGRQEFKPAKGSLNSGMRSANLSPVPVSWSFRTFGAVAAVAGYCYYYF